MGYIAMLGLVLILTLIQNVVIHHHGDLDIMQNSNEDPVKSVSAAIDMSNIADSASSPCPPQSSLTTSTSQSSISTSIADAFRDILSMPSNRDDSVNPRPQHRPSSPAPTRSSFLSSAVFSRASKYALAEDLSAIKSTPSNTACAQIRDRATSKLSDHGVDASSLSVRETRSTQPVVSDSAYNLFQPSSINYICSSSTAVKYAQSLHTRQNEECDASLSDAKSPEISALRNMYVYCANSHHLSSDSALLSQAKQSEATSMSYLFDSRSSIQPEASISCPSCSPLPTLGLRSNDTVRPFIAGLPGTCTICNMSKSPILDCTDCAHCHAKSQHDQPLSLLRSHTMTTPTVAMDLCCEMLIIAALTSAVPRSHSKTICLLLCLLIVLNKLRHASLCFADHMELGASSSCALLTSQNNTVKCFGQNSYGQLGQEDTVNRGDAPYTMGIHLAAINFGTGFQINFLSPSLGFHRCVISDANETKCFGLNSRGQLGYGDTLGRGSFPGSMMGDFLMSVDLGEGFVAEQVVCGYQHTCALSPAHSLKCWGDASYGQLGYGNTIWRGDQVGEMGNNLDVVDLGTGFVPIGIAAGRGHTCSWSSSGTAKCFGRNVYGQLGQGDAADRGDGAGEMGDNLTVIDLGSNFFVVQVCTGDEHTCALSSAGAVKCFGHNYYGQLGIESRDNIGDAAGEMGENLEAVDLGANFTVIAIACGGYYACALSNARSIKCFGRNTYGQLGYGDKLWRGGTSNTMGAFLNAVDVGSDFIPKEVKCGADHTCATSEDDQMKCWGQGGVGQLGYEDALIRGDSIDDMGDNLSAINLLDYTLVPTTDPTPAPTTASAAPTTASAAPTTAPSTTPSAAPTTTPSAAPTTAPTTTPSAAPTVAPSATPTTTPTGAPSTAPSATPTTAPTRTPSASTTAPTAAPTTAPTTAPSASPTTAPSAATTSPTTIPTTAPTSAPTTCYEGKNHTNSNDGYDAQVSNTTFASNSAANQTVIAVQDAQFLQQALTNFQNDVKQQLECSTIASCLFAAISYENNTRCNLLCDGLVSCQGATVTMSGCQSIQIICDKENACEEMVVTVDDPMLNLGDLQVDCVQTTSCNALQISVSATSAKISVSCYEPNACDDILIQSDWTNHQPGVLRMHEYSDNVRFDNGLGYHSFVQTPSVTCNTDHHYIQYNANQSANTNAALTASMLAEYAQNRFPCDGVTILCSNINPKATEAICSMGYSVRSSSDITVDSPDPSASCYWLSVSDIISFSCDGSCTPPSNTPTSAPTTAPTTTPSVAPTSAPTYSPTLAPTLSPTRRPTADIKTLYDTKILADFVLQHLTTANKQKMTSFPLAVKHDLQEIIESSYFDEVDLQYPAFWVNVYKINGILLTDDVNLAISDLGNEAVILPSEIQCSSDIAGFIIRKSKYEDFQSSTEEKLIAYFDNNSNLSFSIANQDSLTAEAIYPPDVPDHTAIIVSAVIVSIGGLISGAAFVFNKIPSTKVDNANFVIPILIALNIYDFGSDINLSVAIFDEAMRFPLNAQNTLLLVAVLSVLFVVAPFLSNMYYAVFISRQHAIKNNPAARAWFGKHLAPFILLCVLCGGTYPVLTLVSSRIFGLNLFNAGLLSSELFALSKIKIRSTIFAENLPQLVLQLVYSLMIHEFSSDTALACIASVLSIFASLVIYQAQKVQKQDCLDTTYFIELSSTEKVTDETKTKIELNKGRKERFGKALSAALKVPQKAIEVGFVTQNEYGCTIHVQHSVFEDDLTKNKIQSSDPREAAQQFVEKLFNVESNRQAIGDAVTKQFEVSEDSQWSVMYREEIGDHAFEMDEMKTYKFEPTQVERRLTDVLESYRWTSNAATKLFLMTFAETKYNNDKEPIAEFAPQEEEDGGEMDVAAAALEEGTVAVVLET